MNTITLSTELMNSILQYLGNRPYVEVANLINGIQQAAVPTTVPVSTPIATPIETPVETPAA